MPQVHHPHRPLHPDRPSLWQPVLRIVSLGGMMAGGYPLFLLLVNYAFWADRPLRALCCLLPCMAAGFLSFFLSRSRNIHLFHGVRVKPRVKHTGGNSSGSGIKILHLFGAHFKALEEKCQLHSLIQRASGVR